MSIDIIKQQTKDLIDRLKSTTNNIGLGNSGNEYTVIVETFLYKFLNDLKSATPFPKCYLHKEKWTFDS